jgi:hypothetical protein
VFPGETSRTVTAESVQPTGGTQGREEQMEDMFDVLAGDHEELRQALAELEKGPTAASGATEDQLMLRTIMTEELIAEQGRHEAAELGWLWPAVRELVPGGEQLADRGVCAELEIVALLAGLGGLDAARPEFEDMLSRLTRAAREHFDFEERCVWPRLRSALRPQWPGESAHHGSFG